MLVGEQQRESILALPLFLSLSFYLSFIHHSSVCVAALASYGARTLAGWG